MKNILKKISVFSLVMASLFVISSCEDNEEGVTNPNELVTTATARFTKAQDGKTISFINLSENTTSYMWDLGDGTTSTLVNPERRYSNGTYTVTLTASNAEGESSTASSTFVIDGCQDETAENVDPANGPFNWTFLNANGDAAFDAFGDIGGGIVNNPVLDAVNSSCNVFQYSKVNGCQTWSGAGYQLSIPLNFATMTNKVFKMKVLAETQTSEVTFLLEREPFPNNTPFVQRVATITEVGQWQELTFDFSDVTVGTFRNMIIYFERNATCDGDVYYFDDILQTQ